jgi:transcriptional regulator with XRE-family HTH domain
MAKVTMEAHGRFGQMLAAAVQKKGISLRDLAAKLDYTYEQMRKLWLGRSAPSKLLLKELCKILDLNFAEADKAATADRMERKYGKAAFGVLGRDPRHGDIEDLLPQLNKQEWDMFVNQIRGYVHQKRKSQ